MAALSTRKALGQHWLHDAHTIARIAESCLAGADLSHPLIEIGPGAGALTFVLLAHGAKVVALEVDARCVASLQQHPAAQTGQLVVQHTDALATDWPVLLATTGATHVVGNLPYNVGTEIVARLLTLPAPPRDMVFLLQKEVVQRLTAKVGSPHWGRLGVLAELYANRARLFDVPPGCFAPPPKVMSSVVHLSPLPHPREDLNPAALDVLLRAGFGQRRKMLRSALKGLLTEAQITATGISPTARMETLNLPQLAALARLLPA